MFGFVKKLKRREHLRLVSENRRMAAELERTYSSAANVAGEGKAFAAAKEMADLIDALDELAAYLDRNDCLSNDEASDMLQLYNHLSSQVAGVEEGRRLARKRMGL